VLPAAGGSGLFLSPVPGPSGDPVSLTAAAGTFTAVHGSIERGRAVMTSASSRAGELGWMGVGALAYGAATTDLTAADQLTAGALAHGAATLRSYAAALATAKETARHANAAVTATNATATRLLAAQDAAGTARDLPKLELEWLHQALPWGKDADDEAWGAALHGWFVKADAAETYGQKFVDDTMVLGTTARVLRGVGGPIAVAGDISTMINPSQAGTMGNIDRVVAGGNALYVGADTIGAVGALAGWETVAALSLGGPVGIGIAVGTGLYLAGAYAYKHFAWFRDDLANPVGHAFADAGQGVEHGIGHLGHDIMSLL
jgi:hypothetical protein